MTDNLNNEITIIKNISNKNCICSGHFRYYFVFRTNEMG